MTKKRRYTLQTCSSRGCKTISRFCPYSPTYGQCLKIPKVIGISTFLSPMTHMHTSGANITYNNAEVWLTDRQTLEHTDVMVEIILKGSFESNSLTELLKFVIKSRGRNVNEKKIKKNKQMDRCTFTWNVWFWNVLIEKITTYFLLVCPMASGSATICGKWCFMLRQTEE